MDIYIKCKEKNKIENNWTENQNAFSANVKAVISTSSSVVINLIRNDLSSYEQCVFCQFYKLI